MTHNVYLDSRSPDPTNLRAMASSVLARPKLASAAQEPAESPKRRGIQGGSPRGGPTGRKQDALVLQIPARAQPLRAAVEKGRGREEIKLLRRWPRCTRTAHGRPAALLCPTMQAATALEGPSTSGCSVDFWVMRQPLDGLSTSGRSVNRWMVRRPGDGPSIRRPLDDPQPLDDPSTYL